MSKSELEADLWIRMHAHGLATGFVRDWSFYPGRKWRFDFQEPVMKIAIEVEGGTWSGGAHTRPQGFQEDCEKYNEAALAGWLLLRFTGADIKNGSAIEMIERAIIVRGNWWAIELVLQARLRRAPLSGGRLVAPPEKKRRASTRTASKLLPRSASKR